MILPPADQVSLGKQADELPIRPARIGVTRFPSAIARVSSGALRPLRLLMQEAGVKLLALACLLSIWYLASLPFDALLFPGPHIVARRFWHVLVQEDYLPNLSYTMARVMVGFLLGMSIGTGIGLAMGAFRLMERALDLIVLMLITVPGLCWALIGILIFGIRDSAAWFVVAIAVSPIVALNVWQGAKAVDTELVTMARAFNTKPRRMVIHVVLPQLLPCLLAAARYGLGFAWKVVLLMEMFGLSSGIGFQIAKEWAMISMEGVMAWAAGFTIVLFALELAVFQPLERRLTVWRPAARLS